LIFVAGFAGIAFLFMFIVRVAFPWIFQSKNQSRNEPLSPSLFSGFIILVLTSVAFAFYLRYVGGLGITFHIMFKIILISLAPPLVLGLHDANMELKHQNELLIIEKKMIQAKIEKYEEDILNKSIEFFSETNTESLNLLVAEVAFIKSADNYVEIVYKEGENLKKKLIRSTMKNVELQLKQYSIFIRCHRICIVNMHYIEKLNRNFNNHWLSIKGYHEQLPVSRQYLIKLKEAL
jgi:hypothetical protein